MRSSVLAAVGGLLLIFVAVASPRPAASQGAAGQSSVQEEKTAFYADVRAKRYEQAIVEGARARKQDPADDRFALDYAYALLSAHRPAQATAVLEHIKNSRVASVRTAARKQLAAQQRPASAFLPPTAAASPPPFTNAYELLAGGDLAASRDAFVATLAQHPGDAAAWRQLSYIDFVLKDRPAMIAALDHYIALEPTDDRAKLERAYALLASGDLVRAKAALVSLEQSPNAEVAQAAKAQVAAGAGNGGKPARLDAFGYAIDDSRFHDTFYGMDVRYALATTKIQPYVDLAFSNDAKASSLPANEILNDNVAILSLGLRTKLTPILYAFVQGGEAQSLLTGQQETDLRYGLLLSDRLGTGGFKPQTQIDASLTRYSRYANTIFYANIAHDFYIGNKVVRGVAGTNFALDASRAFYNNAAEGFAGVQVRRGLFTFREIAVGGTYLGRGIGVPADSTYTSFRTELLFGYQH